MPRPFSTHSPSFAPTVLRRAPGVFLVVLASLLTACGGGGGSKVSPNYPVSGGSGINQPVPVEGAPLPDTSLRGGAMVQFVAVGNPANPSEPFSAWITHGASIDALADVWNGVGDPLNHIGAVFLAGEGEQDHNHPWSWHVAKDRPVIPNATVPFDVPPGALRIPHTWPSLLEADLDFYTGSHQQIMVVRLVGFDDRR